MTGRQDGYPSIISGEFSGTMSPRRRATTTFINRQQIIPNKNRSSAVPSLQRWDQQGRGSELLWPDMKSRKTSESADSVLLDECTRVVGEERTEQSSCSREKEERDGQRQRYRP
ncbi:hypothetical protein SRHO_G00258950 [Serrasalmus rhombeus]